jgi:FkbM family methyltransferase
MPNAFAAHLAHLTMRSRRRLSNLRAHMHRVATDERLRSAAVNYGRLDYPGAVIHLQLTSRSEFHRLRSCEKEPWTVRWIEEYLNPGEVLYDAGANVGAYTILAAVTTPALRVVSFEPSPANFAALCANLELNQVGDRVIPVPLALGDRARSARLDRDDGVPGTAPRVVDGGSAEERTVAVLVERLDQIVARFGLPEPNHLKLDVEGAELEVLAGGERLLASGGLKSVMAELDPRRGDEVVDRLVSLGFELLERASAPGRPRGAPDYGLFVRP